MTGRFERTIAIDAVARIRVEATNRSSTYAAQWLDCLTGARHAGDDEAPILIRGRDAGATSSDPGGADCVIDLWDNQVGHAGDGRLASALSGAATVIGRADGPPVPLPADMPEKWCGAYGVILALAECWRQRAGHPVRAEYQVSAADVLRSFCLQNSGGREEMARSWRRNGRLCIEHGGIFPMGFFACRDGYVAVLGRSRRDWKNIRAAIGNPAWANGEDYENPFALARNSAVADALLEQTLSAFDRDDLLARGIAHGAVIAPVYTQDEAAQRGIFRGDFIGDAGPAMPFTTGPLTAAEPATSARRADRSIAGLPDDGPLSGLRAIELCWIWSGPMVGQILADLGAEVIKVESRDRFDLYRTRGLEAMRGKMDEATRIESSLYFHSLNRNKRGLTLDLKSDAGRRALRDLAARSDLLLENFTVGTLERMGFGADVLAVANPNLVVLSMSGPGRGSSVEALRSYGLVLSALAGAEQIIRDDDGFLGSPTFSISDPNAAVFATIAAIAGALSAQEKGAGLAIDVSQIEAAATLAGTPSEPRQPAHVRATSDGGFAIATDDGARSPVLALEDTDAADQFADCSGWISATHPVTGSEDLVAAPWRVDGRRPQVRCAAPVLGEGDADILREVLHYTNDEITQLQGEDSAGSADRLRQ